MRADVAAQTEVASCYASLSPLVKPARDDRAGRLVDNQRPRRHDPTVGEARPPSAGAPALRETRQIMKWKQTMSVVAEHDYVGRVHEEIQTLEQELADQTLRADLAKVAARLGLESDLALAAIFRASRRSGLSLRLMVAEVNGQLDRAERPRD
jgi:hypothetical protein